MLMLADAVEFVIGVDTHKDTHTAAILDGRTRAQLAEVTVAADALGYRQLLGWAAGRCPGSRMWAVEGTGSYGAGLTAVLMSAAEGVREVDRVRRPRRGDKNDVIDAARAAAEALLRELPKPRSAGHRNALRMILSCRKGAVDARTATVNELKALIVTVPETIRGQLRGRRGAALRDAITGLPLPWDIDDIDSRYSVYALQQLAIRISWLDADIAGHDQHLTDLLDGFEWLLEPIGIGPVGAAQLLISFSYPGRIRSEAAFAALAGVNPIEASSGRTKRHRLNRRGDRKLNTALHRIALIRMHHDEETIAYADRRRAEGKTNREIMRCIKRALARRLFKLMTQNIAQPQHAA